MLAETRRSTTYLALPRQVVCLEAAPVERNEQVCAAIAVGQRDLGIAHLLASGLYFGRKVINVSNWSRRSIRQSGSGLGRPVGAKGDGRGEGLRIRRGVAAAVSDPDAILLVCN